MLVVTTSCVLENLPENLIVNYGEESLRTSISKTKPHPPPKKPLPMYQLATPVTEWRAPGAYTTRRCVLENLDN